MEEKAVTLNRISVKNEKLFVNSIVNIIIPDSLCTVGRPFYVYSIWVDKYESDYSEIDIGFIPISAFSDGGAHGYFYIEDLLFIIRGDLLDSLFEITTENKDFKYEEEMLQVNGIEIPMMDPEEFSTWHFAYDETNIFLLDKICYSK